VLMVVSRISHSRGTIGTSFPAEPIFPEEPSHQVRCGTSVNLPESAPA